MSHHGKMVVRPSAFLFEVCMLSEIMFSSGFTPVFSHFFSNFSVLSPKHAGLGCVGDSKLSVEVNVGVYVLCDQLVICTKWMLVDGWKCV